MWSILAADHKILNTGKGERSQHTAIPSIPDKCQNHSPPPSPAATLHAKRGEVGEILYKAEQETEELGSAPTGKIRKVKEHEQNIKSACPFQFSVETNKQMT